MRTSPVGSDLAEGPAPDTRPAGAASAAKVGAGGNPLLAAAQTRGNLVTKRAHSHLAQLRVRTTEVGPSERKADLRWRIPPPASRIASAPGASSRGRGSSASLRPLRVTHLPLRLRGSHGRKGEPFRPHRERPDSAPPSIDTERSAPPRIVFFTRTVGPSSRSEMPRHQKCAVLGSHRQGETGEVFAPYDGGADLIVRSSERAKALRAGFVDWLSGRADGL